MKVGTDCDKLEKLIKYSMYVQYIKKAQIKKKKKNSQGKEKNFTVFFLRMVAYKTHLNVIGKLTWIGKMMYNIIK